MPQDRTADDEQHHEQEVPAFGTDAGDLTTATCLTHTLFRNGNLFHQPLDQLLGLLALPDLHESARDHAVHQDRHGQTL